MKCPKCKQEMVHMNSPDDRNDDYEYCKNQKCSFFGIERNMGDG